MSDLIKDSSLAENISVNMETYSRKADRVGGDGLRGERRCSVVLVMSIPTWISSFLALGGMVVPAKATIESWWLTLNSTVGIEELEAERTAADGMKQGRWCGAGVRLMVIWDQGMRQVRWMKRYLRRLEARDMCLSFR